MKVGRINKAYTYFQYHQGVDNMDIYNIEEVHKLVEHLMGREVTIKSIGNHDLLRNSVYLVGYGEKNVIFKLYYKRNRCNREIASLKILENSKTKSPVLLDKGLIEDDIEWIFISYLEGIPLHDLIEELSEAEILDVMNAMGKELSIIHDVMKFDYFGEWACKQNGFYKNSNYKDVFCNKLQRIEESLSFQNLPDYNLHKKGVEYIYKNMDILDDVKIGHFCHNDFDDRNILVKKENGKWKLSGVIDFEHSMPWDVDADFISLYGKYFLKHKDWEKAFFTGYGSEKYKKTEFIEKMNFYLVYRGLEICSWSYKRALNYYKEGINLIESYA